MLDGEFEEPYEFIDVLGQAFDRFRGLVPPGPLPLAAERCCALLRA